MYIFIFKLLAYLKLCSCHYHFLLLLWYCNTLSHPQGGTANLLLLHKRNSEVCVCVWRWKLTCHHSYGTIITHSVDQSTSLSFSLSVSQQVLQSVTRLHDLLNTLQVSHFFLGPSLLSVSVPLTLSRPTLMRMGGGTSAFFSPHRKSRRCCAFSPL